jgi:hypothetical protein
VSCEAPRPSCNPARPGRDGADGRAEPCADQRTRGLGIALADALGKRHRSVDVDAYAHDDAELFTELDAVVNAEPERKRITGHRAQLRREVRRDLDEQ